jgi:curved DNA-binding protein
MNVCSKYEEYFNILNIEKTNDLNKIKQAYRKLSLKHHPDKNGDNNTFNIITQAYKTLVDNISNNIFINLNTDTNTNLNVDTNTDTNLNTDTNINRQKFNNTCDDNNITNYNQNNINVLCTNVDNINISIDVTFIQVYNGCCIPVKITRYIKFNNILKEEVETIYVEIPKGTDDNEIITIKEQGNIVDSKQSDVKICVKLIPHNIFKRSGLDIIYTKTITLKESLIGFNYNFTHINNKNYKIISNNLIKDNHSETIKDLGFNRNNYTGNLYIIYKIEYPEQLTKQLIDSIKEYM